jgi:two-component system cell cycle sensor histidine kinase/response regulator CckA
MMHPLLQRLLRRVGATTDAPPTLEEWQALQELVSRTFHNADQDRYTIERAMEISGREMQGLYQELERRAGQELAAARGSEQRQRLLFRTNPVPIFVMDTKTCDFIDVNNATCAMFGYTLDELVERSLTSLKPADEPGLAANMQIAVDELVHLGVRRYTRKDGKVIEADVTAHRLLLDGRDCVLTVALDVTESRRVEAELRQAQKMEAIGRLAGGIAHDFNNILAVILANAEFTLDEIGEHHAASEEVREIVASAERAAGLTRQLLTFSRKQKRQLKILALNSIVGSIDGMLKRIVGEDIAISSAVAPDLGAIEADPGEVEQVVMNLVVNARDAMPRGGTLVIETANAIVDDAYGAQIDVAPGRYVVLSITDSGCGMTAAVRARIFEPFFTTKDVDKGTGLGLATVFGIVKQSNGGISVYSELGRGTTFRVYWPRRDAAPAKRERDRKFIAARGKGTVLVVEDDGQLRKVLRRYLTSWGYTLLEAPNALAAMDLLSQHAGAIDVLLTDLVMPGLDGRSLSQHVLAGKPSTKVVFMSGYTEHAALKNAQLGPDDHFVQKPFSAQVLSETLQRALGHTVPAR